MLIKSHERYVCAKPCAYIDRLFMNYVYTVWYKVSLHFVGDAHKILC
jgi:hypothetical protein